VHPPSLIHTLNIRIIDIALFFYMYSLLSSPFISIIFFAIFHFDKEERVLDTVGQKDGR